MTKFPWPEIELRLHQRRLCADDLKERFPEEGEFFPRFADMADEVLEAANDDCIEDASIRITDILIDLGCVPAEHRQN